jgi:ribosome-binding ATPase YchF (GTP1/OBG family)
MNQHPHCTIAPKVGIVEVPDLREGSGPKSCEAGQETPLSQSFVLVFVLGNES